MVMKRSAIVAVTGLAIMLLVDGNPAEVNAEPVSYNLPEETAAFKPDPNLEMVQGRALRRQCRGDQGSDRRRVGYLARAACTDGARPWCRLKRSAMSDHSNAVIPMCARRV